MTFLKEQAIRLLRTKWNSAQELAEELFAIFNNDRPMVVDGDLTVNGKITSNKDGQSTTIDPTVPEPEPDPIPPPPAAVLFADGSDGDVAVTTEINLSRDMFYKNLTLSGAGKINTKNYRIFVSEILDLTGAGTDAINNKGNHGQYEDPNTYSFYFTATNTTVPETAHTCGTGCRGGAGGAAATLGTAASPQPAYTGVGGRSGPGGTGGSAETGAVPGKAGGGGQLVSGQTPVALAQTAANYFTGTGYTLLQGGAGGGGGGGGAGSTGIVPATTGIAGGSGGNGGGVLSVLARTIQVGSGTAAGALNANGGNGGNAPITGDTGSAGGGGGGGGGGGYVFLIYGEILGQASTNWIQCNGGRGGNGTKGWPSRSCTGGQGGNGGGSGAITLIDYYNSEVSQSPRSSGVGDTPAIPTQYDPTKGSDGITNEISLSEED